VSETKPTSQNMRVNCSSYLSNFLLSNLLQTYVEGTRMKLFLLLSFLCQSFAFQGPSHSHQNVRLDSLQLSSVPNPIDTSTSGLASIIRVGENGLAGVTVSSNAKAAADIRLKLYDIENSSNCRVVRELVTELDLVVEIIPVATSSSNTLPDGAEVPCLVASLPGGEEKVMSGVSDVTEFLKETFSEGTIVVSKESSLEEVIQALAPVSLFATGALRTGRGIAVTPAVTSSVRVNRPQDKLILYSYEGNQFCRLVREVLTELDITYEVRSAGKGSPRRSELAELTGGSTMCPYLGTSPERFDVVSSMLPFR
jgi:arsenate reductase-like glutaredoxin family protein